MLAAALDVRAAGIAVEPGLWEMTSTVSMPMLPQPQTHTMTLQGQTMEMNMSWLGKRVGDCP
jgi:hypothetical protein